MSSYEVAVIGTGGIGSAVLYQLAGQGLRVVGIERFSPPHHHGSSHGQTRIIRQAHFEDPRYTPLMQKSYLGWQELEQFTGRLLMKLVGLLQVGSPSGLVISGVRQAAAENRQNLGELTSAEVEKRWPVFRVPSGMIGLFESNAGYLFVERCVKTYVEAACQLGATLLSNCEVHSWQPGKPIRMQTTQGEIQAERLIITAGPWASHLLGPLNLKLQLLRKSMVWYAVEKSREAAAASLPAFLFELSTGVFYGFPPLDERGMKLAAHSGGTPIKDPLQIEQGIQPDDLEQMEQFHARCLPGVLAEKRDHAFCMYTMSPDEHFIVDHHPYDRNVVFAAGLSGHGFKFAPVLATALADLCLEGTTSLPIDFVRLDRFQQS